MSTSVSQSGKLGSNANGAALRRRTCLSCYMTRELLFLWRKFRWNWPWSHDLFLNFWPQHRNWLIPGSFCIIFHGEHDPHSLNPSIWPRTREITIFSFLCKFWERHVFRQSWTWGYFGRQMNCGGAFWEVMWPGSDFWLKTNARFPCKVLAEKLSQEGGVDRKSDNKKYTFTWQ